MKPQIRIGRIKPRKKLRRGEPTKQEKIQARMECFARARGRCEMPFPHPCPGYVVLSMGELAHLKAKRRFGWMESEETGQKHLWACPEGHRLQHAYGWTGVKPCPPKGATGLPPAQL